METETLKKKKTEAVPKLRFKEFEEDWTKDKLKNLTSILRCGIAATPKYVENGIPFLSAQNVTKEGLVSLEKYSEISEDYYLELSRKHKLLPGDLLYSRVGAGFGTAAIFSYDGKFGVYVSLTHIRVNTKLCNKYLKFYLNSNLGKIQAKRGVFQGGGVPNLNVKVVEKFKIRFPSLPEQQKIASFLSSIDKKIQQLTRKKELLESYKKGVMQQLFSQEIRFKDETGKDFPEWEKKNYGDIYNFLSTNSFSRNDLNYEAGTVKNIHYGDIHTKFPNLFHLSKEMVPFINNDKDLSKINSENYCREGDLVIADASEDYKDIGKSIEIIDLNGEKVLAGLHTFLARPNPDLMYKGFSGYLVQTWKFRKQVMTIAQGTKVLGLSISRMKKLKVEIPSLKEQQKIANFLSGIDKKIEAVSQQITQTQSFKKGLLQQMFV